MNRLAIAIVVAPMLFVAALICVRQAPTPPKITDPLEARELYVELVQRWQGLERLVSAIRLIEIDILMIEDSDGIPLNERRCAEREMILELWDRRATLILAYNEGARRYNVDIARLDYDAFCPATGCPPRHILDYMGKL